MSIVASLRGTLSLGAVEPYVSTCLSDTKPVSKADLGNLEQLAAYLDGTYFILRHLHTKLKEAKRSNVPKSTVYFENALLVMDILLRPERKPSDVLGQPIKPKSDLARHTRLSYLRHTFTQLWMVFFDNEIPDELILKAMRLLGDGRLSRLAESRLLADYVIPIFDQPSDHTDSTAAAPVVPPSWSRAVSRTVLGLVHKGGLNYARLYPRLYELLDDSLLVCPEVGRFLDDLNIYLSSMHLSYNVLASFLKRLAQLAVLSPSRLTPAFLLLIRNTLRHHVKCSFLVTQRKPGTTHGSLPSNSVGDPYRWDPKQLDSSGAMNSSLWEIASLIHHHSPTVSALAQEICHPRLETALVESGSPSQLIQQQDEELALTTKSVQQKLLTLAQSNARMPVLPDLEGWVH